MKLFLAGVVFLMGLYFWQGPDWVLLVGAALMLLPVLALAPGAYLWDRWRGASLDDGPTVWCEGEPGSPV